MKEEYRFINGYTNYKVSNLGSVKRLNYRKKGSEKILRCSPNTKGYRKVDFTENGVTKTMKVHQLVAMAFLGHEPKGYTNVVDHIDGDKLNNNVSNLRIVTHRENVSLARNKSGFIGAYKSKSGRYVSKIHVNGETFLLGTFDTPEEANRAYKNKLKQINYEK